MYKKIKTEEKVKGFFERNETLTIILVLFSFMISVLGIAYLGYYLFTPEVSYTGVPDRYNITVYEYTRTDNNMTHYSSEFDSLYKDYSCGEVKILDVKYRSGCYAGNCTPYSEVFTPQRRYVVLGYQEFPDSEIYVTAEDSLNLNQPKGTLGYSGPFISGPIDQCPSAPVILEEVKVEIPPRIHFHFNR